jgi:hypothetical protein
MSMKPEEVRALCVQFSALHDGQLAPAEIAALEKTLQNDRSARRLYIRYSRICAGLDWDSFQSRDLPLSQEEQLKALVPQQPSIAFAPLSRKHRSTAEFFSRRTRFTLPMTAALASILTALVTIYILRPSRETLTVQVENRPRAVAPLEVGSVRIDSGTARIALPRIGYAILEGPAEFSVIGPLRARLTEGRIRVRVTEKTGHGFVVETPIGQITDLGTEFGVDLRQQGKAGFLVFEGSARVSEGATPEEVSQGEHLVGGEGVELAEGGARDRISYVSTGNAPTFLRDNDAPAAGSSQIILSVTDNLNSKQTRKFYEIVPGGLQEDALCYVDRPLTQWNGVGPEGMPSYLGGADYVKPFNDDKMRKGISISVALARPAKLFVFFDDRLQKPAWLTENFRDTGDKLGSDFGPWAKNTGRFKNATGPGVSIDAVFSVWERIVSEPGIVALGENPGKSIHTSSMYGIAAIPWEPGPAVSQQATETRLFANRLKSVDAPQRHASAGLSEQISQSLWGLYDR